MNKRVRQRHKETASIVGTGLLVNYPLQILVIYLLLDILHITESFWVATYSTMIMTVFAYVRVYVVRRYFDKQ
jgi:hypothetical protein